MRERVNKVHQELMGSPAQMLDIDRRIDALRSLSAGLCAYEEKIYLALEQDLHRPRFETYIAEIALVKAEIDYALKNIRRLCKPRSVKTGLAFLPGSSSISPKPKGLVLIISPWNYPIQLSLAPLVSAIAAGNRAIVKPSPLAPASAEVITDIVNESLDNSCFRAIKGDDEVAKALLDLPFDHIFFTGSARIGEQVMHQAAKHLTPVTLELGGKSPVIIDDRCDLALASKRILWGKSINAGQTCVAPDYLLIGQHRIDEFISHFRSHALSMFGEQPHLSPDLGRIINHRHLTRLVSYLDQGRVAYGGQNDPSSKFLAPTILVDVPADAPVMGEEIFGPILPVIGVKKIDDAIDAINHRPSPLVIYIFSSDQQLIERVMEQTTSGSVAINDCVSQVGVIDLPFGGVGASGMGNYRGRHGFNTFSHQRAVYQRANVLDNPIRYAPHHRWKIKAAKFIL